MHSPCACCSCLPACRHCCYCCCHCCRHCRAPAQYQLPRTCAATVQRWAPGRAAPTAACRSTAACLQQHCSAGASRDTTTSATYAQQQQQQQHRTTHQASRFEPCAGLSRCMHPSCVYVCRHAAAAVAGFASLATPLLVSQVGQLHVSRSTAQGRAWGAPRGHHHACCIHLLTSA